MPGLEPDGRWLRLWTDLGARGDAREAWTELLARYAEPARRYHTLEHVRECLELLGTCRELASDLPAVEAALWYHDVVYDPRGSGNEEASAVLARERLGAAGVDDARVQTVARLILATRHAAGPQDPDEALVVDLDLAILGADRERFDRYERAIRDEYAFVPEDVFRAARAHVLQGFLDREALYATRHWRERLEERARANLATSLAALGAV